VIEVTVLPPDTGPTTSPLASDARKGNMLVTFGGATNPARLTRNPKTLVVSRYRRFFSEIMNGSSNPPIYA
jgi:hypothetical protein